MGCGVHPGQLFPTHNPLHSKPNSLQTQYLLPLSPIFPLRINIEFSLFAWLSELSPLVQSHLAYVPFRTKKPLSSYENDQVLLINVSSVRGGAVRTPHGKRGQCISLHLNTSRTLLWQQTSSGSDPRILTLNGTMDLWKISWAECAS